MSATHHRDLRTGRSIWEDRRLPALAAVPLTRDTRTDVLVIGAGISGAMVADLLSDSGCRVMVVDRRRPFTGSTTASTALVQYDIDMPLTHLGRRVGEERARRLWRRSKLALDALKARARHLGIDADCVARDSLYLEGNVLGRRALKDEAAARQRAGFEVTLLDAAAVERRFGIAGRSGVLSYDQLSADPRRLAHGFLAAAVGRGARVCSPVEIANVRAARGGVRAWTSDGRVVSAGHLVFATGYELAKGVPTAGHRIASTWAIATRPQPSRLWPERCFIWEASDPYLYLRAGPDGRIICGGEDEEFADEASRDALLARKTATLERKLHALLPAVDSRAAFAWCGSFGGSTAGTPTIGPIPGMPRCYAVLGYGGNGITFAALAAQLVRAAIIGRPDPDAALFAFGRARR
jgi:glycine/D-amino acid oxidase-like deaminating enzyme